MSKVRESSEGCKDHICFPNVSGKGIEMRSFGTMDWPTPFTLSQDQSQGRANNVPFLGGAALAYILGLEDRHVALIGGLKLFCAP